VLSKSHGKLELIECDVSEGSLVYVIPDKDKTKSHEKYIIVSKHGDCCKVRKFTKNQYRSKLYNVKLSKVYPITKSTPGGTRKVDPVADSSESDDHLDESTDHL